MNPDRWLRVKEVFNAALELEAAQRAAFLDQACAGDAQLRAELDSLLASHDRPGAFLDTPALASDDADSRWIGRRVGPYRIVEEIGAGGMGEIYKAVRADDQYEKQVAIKLVRGGYDTQFILERFKAERQILASLEHPNIARLIDGGATEDGLPYLVMELVEGVPINEYCDRHGLAVGDRLALFRTVCSAVSYAHQHLVVHRDLKPNNILVTADRSVKLLDFGIAKLLDAATIAEQSQPTATLLRVMTLEYSSPEQVRGEPVTTASDVYSLGVLLYHLLTGQSPYRSTGGATHEVIREICETEPVRPSAALALSTGGRGSEKTRRVLRGDLDNIVLMALRKDPKRRYASVEQLSEDVGRYLSELPVRARGDDLGYRAGKFIRRHRIGLAATAIVFLALIGGIAATLREAHIAQAERAKAERRFNDVRELANALLFEIHDAIRDVPGSTHARQILVSKALKYLDSLAQEAGGDSSLQQELASAYERVGDVQGNPYEADLGDTAGALASYEKGLAIREALAAASPTNKDSRRQLANSHILIASVLDHTTRSSEALEHIEQALRLNEQLAGENPQDHELRRNLSRSHSRVCGMLGRMRRTAEAIEHCRRALAISKELVDKGPRTGKALRDLALDHSALGFLLLADAAGRDEALLHLRQEVALAEERAANEPGSAGVRDDLSGSYSDMGRALDVAGDLRGARQYLEKTITLDEAALAADPRNAQNQRGLAVDLSGLASVFEKSGRLAEALDYQNRTLKILEAMVAASPANAQARKDEAEVLRDIATLHAKRGEMPQAFEFQRKSVTLRESLAAAAPPCDLRFRSGLAGSYKEMGDLFETSAVRTKSETEPIARNLQEARSWYQRSLGIWASLEHCSVPPPATARNDIVQQIAKCDAEIAKLTLRGAKSTARP